MAATNRSGISRTAWTLMLKEGGLWSVAELAEQLDAGAVDLRNSLVSMARNGMVSIKPVDSKGHVRYAVTHDCKVPQGVTVQEMMGILTPETPAAVTTHRTPERALADWRA